MFRSLPPVRLLWARRRGCVVTLMLLGALAGCARLDSAPPVEEASFNQNAMANGLYYVQRGDTLYSIDWKTGVDFRRLAALNGLEPPYNIEPGQPLRLNDSVSLPGAGQASGGEGTRAIALNGSDPQGPDSSDDSWLVPAAESPASAGSNGASRVASGAVGAATGVAAAGSARASSGASQDVAPDSGASESGSAEGGASEGAVSEASAAEDAAPQGADRGREPDSVDSAAQGDADGQDTGGTAVAGNRADRSDRTFTPAESIDWVWPTEGEIVGNFGDTTNLTAGIDIAGQKGQSVKAAGPGIVVYAGDGVRGYGNLIILKHNDRFLSAYAHNDSLNVEENDVVRKGETIATMGSTDTDSVKLHFEIRQDGQPRDPLQYLPDR